MRASERIKREILGQPLSSLNDRASQYRGVFSTPGGVNVLIDILRSHRLLAPIQTEADIALHNEAIATLCKLGILYDGPDPKKKDLNNHEVIAALIGVRIGE